MDILITVFFTSLGWLTALYYQRKYYHQVITRKLQKQRVERRRRYQGTSNPVNREELDALEIIRQAEEFLNDNKP